MKPKSETIWIEARAKALGCDLCGVVTAEKFPELAHNDEWLAEGYAGEMRYLHDPRRSNPQNAMPDIRSVIVCGLNYLTEPAGSTETAGDNEEPRGWLPN